MAPFTLQTPGPSGSQEAVTFSVPSGPVAFAGSRHGSLSHPIRSLLFQMLSSLDFSFMTGCATGIDQAFRRTMTDSRFTQLSQVICAFQARVDKARAKGLKASLVSEPGIHPHDFQGLGGQRPVPALRNRTIWLVENCVMLFLFPDDPYTGLWGKGSKLAFNTAIDKQRPVFVTSTKPPPCSLHYYVIPSDFFGIIQGYWVVPATIIKEENVA